MSIITNIFKSGGDIGIQEGTRDAKFYNRQAIVERGFNDDNTLEVVIVKAGETKIYSIALSNLKVEGVAPADKAAAIAALATVFPNAGGSALPTQTGNDGKYLKTDGSSASWQTVAGGGPALIEKTKAQIDTLISGSGLTVGCFYKITDRGDRGLIFQALKVNQLSKEGRRLMLCPADYIVETDGHGNVWKGVWRGTKSFAINDLAIWGGLVWKNITVSSGGSDSDRALDIDNWQVIPKASFANHEYVEREFGVIYDYEHDYVVEQWDEFGNRFGGIDYDSDQNFGNGYPVVDICDWNCVMRGIGGDGAIMTNNKVTGIYNNDEQCSFIGNSGAGLIFANEPCSISGNVNCGISGNINITGIFRNFCCGINGNESSGNTSISQNVNCNIYSNTVQAGDIRSNIEGDIHSNNLSGNNGICYNHVKSIISNNCSEIIGNNFPHHEIRQNSIGNHAISFNSIGNDINSNTNTGQITDNRCSSSIVSNSNTGGIYNNANNGQIYNNTNTGSIYNNINNADISGNNSAGNINNTVGW